VGDEGRGVGDEGRAVANPSLWPLSTPLLWPLSKLRTLIGLSCSAHHDDTVSHHESESVSQDERTTNLPRHAQTNTQQSRDEFSREGGGAGGRGGEGEGEGRRGARGSWGLGLGMKGAPFSRAEEEVRLLRRAKDEIRVLEEAQNGKYWDIFIKQLGPRTLLLLLL
jgi:hypothetical protein